MSLGGSSSEKLRVIVVGGGVAALETVLALHDLAGELIEGVYAAGDCTGIDACNREQLASP